MFTNMYNTKTDWGRSFKLSISPVHKHTVSPSVSTLSLFRLQLRYRGRQTERETEWVRQLCYSYKVHPFILRPPLIREMGQWRVDDVMLKGWGHKYSAIWGGAAPVVLDTQWRDAEIADSVPPQAARPSAGLFSSYPVCAHTHTRAQYRIMMWDGILSDRTRYDI